MKVSIRSICQIYVACPREYLLHPYSLLKKERFYQIYFHSFGRSRIVIFLFYSSRRLTAKTSIIKSICFPAIFLLIHHWLWMHLVFDFGFWVFLNIWKILSLKFILCPFSPPSDIEAVWNRLGRSSGCIRQRARQVESDEGRKQCAGML